MRHGPAAELQHLARHLGVAALVGLEQRPATEQRRGTAAPRARGAPHRDRRAGATSVAARAGARCALSRAIGSRRPRVVYFDSPARRGQCWTGSCVTRRPASMNSAGSQRCAPSNSGVSAVDAVRARRRGTPAPGRPGRSSPGASSSRRTPLAMQRRQPPRGRVAPPDADTAGEVGVAQRLDQARQVFRAALEVGVEGRDQLAPRDAEARDQRRGLAGSPVVSEVAQPGLRGGQRGQHLLGLIAAAVVDDDQLPGDGGGVERLAHLGHQGAEVRSLVVGRDHDAQSRRGRMAVAGRRVPHRVTSASWSLRPGPRDHLDKQSYGA